MPFPYYENRCQNCGTVYKENDLYCSKCGAFLIKPELREDALLNDIEKSKWCAYIEKKTERYMPIFEKNKDKKFFASPNIAAMLCGMFWLFYRKMYKEGAIFIAVNFILSLLLSAILLFSYQGDIKENIKIIDEYNSYYGTLSEETKNELSYADYETRGNLDDDFITSHNEKLNKAYEAQDKINSIATAITLWGYLMNITVSVIFGLFADSIYRNHIIRNIKYSDGGTSAPAIFGALVINILINLISDPISEFITNLFIR